MKDDLLTRLRTPCGRTTGYGDNCARGWECSACADKALAAAIIEKLQAGLSVPDYVNMAQAGVGEYAHGYVNGWNDCVNNVRIKRGDLK